MDKNVYKPDLNIEETLLLAGIKNDKEVTAWANIIKSAGGYFEANTNFKEVVGLISDAYEQAVLNGTYPIKLIKQISAKMDKLIRPELQTQEQALHYIMSMQSKKEKPTTKFLLEANKMLQYKTYGLKNGFYVISADSQIGKTGFILQLAVDVLMSNPDSNVIFISLDDTKLEMMNRIVCSIVYRSLPDKSRTDLVPEINCVPSGYSYWDDDKNYFTAVPEVEKLKEMATQIMAEYISKKRLTVIDGMLGFSGIENAILEKLSDKTLLIVDAAYNVNENFKNDLEKDAMASLFFKLLPVKYGISVIAVKELSKKMKAKGSQLDETGERKRDVADIGDTKGSVIWEYNCNAMATLYQYKDKICINFQKNKISGRKFVRYYDQAYLKNAYRELDLVIKKKES